MPMVELSFSIFIKENSVTNNNNNNNIIKNLTTFAINAVFNALDFCWYACACSFPLPVEEGGHFAHDRMNRMCVLWRLSHPLDNMSLFGAIFRKPFNSSSEHNKNIKLISAFDAFVLNGTHDQGLSH